MTEITSYHGQAVIKEPIWTWEIPMYFFTGGMAGASAGLAHLSGLRGNDVLARRAWAISLGAIGISPAFLISDLGRPARFLNMLRMFKVTSPMSVGSWILGASGAATTLAAANAWTGFLPRPARVARPAAALLGLPLSTYTAALVANTAVPVWHEARRVLPFVFGSGAALSAGAAAVIATPTEHAGPARRLALASAALELGLNEAMRRQLGEHAEPYKRGAPSKLRVVSGAAIATGAALLVRRGSSSRAAAVAAGSLLAAGAACARWTVFRAGFVSASDPKYVIEPQRRNIDRGERRGAARREATVRDARPAAGSPATAPAVVRDQQSLSAP
ncbi:MAG TPA: NrfD/PsrC family molybdoenzyme membrane anchor subunit [Solirubrobacteraceae bacterium]|nr:NrfD/PsrC family molybdoenzyme membrane anchor subunit [Solirubrobacteraceae bacterium]